MEKLIPSSLSGRLLFVSMLVLLLFLPLAGLVLEQAYNNSLDKRLQEKLKVQTYSIMGLADELEPGELWLPESLPDERFNQLGSGLYAEVTNGQGRSLWQSQSSLNIQLPSPIPDVPGEVNIEDIITPGKFFYDRIKLIDQQLLEIAKVSIIWEGPDESENIYTFMVAESLTPYEAEKKIFRETLVFWLGGLGLFLLLIDALALIWALKPLNQLADEIHQVERGDRHTLDTAYPTELNQVANNINTLINHEQKQRKRYRNTLQDLAHSLKTPLAVIQASLSKIENIEVRELLAEHIERMNKIVGYQLQRAVSSGPSPIKQKVEVRACLIKIFEALDKVYYDKKIDFHNNISNSCLFYGDENDLLEILGNLTDNACKYGRSEVFVNAHISASSTQQSSTIILSICDNGPGIPANLQDVIFQRGKRLDENNEGQGIGLSVVSDIVASYKGTINVAMDNDLNTVRITLPGTILED